MAARRGFLHPFLPFFGIALAAQFVLVSCFLTFSRLLPHHRLLHGESSIAFSAAAAAAAATAAGEGEAAPSYTEDRRWASCRWAEAGPGGEP